MPWCPSCKLEYVEGIKICPDCKSALVGSLDELVEEEELSSYSENYSEENTENNFDPNDLDDETKQEMINRMKQIIENPTYRCKEEQYDENKSGAYVLTVCGIIGAIVLILNLAGVISLPFSGFSMTLTYVVMGFLFMVFFVSGIRSFFKMNKLKPLVDEEKKNIDKVLDFLKVKKDAGSYTYSDDESYEEAYLRISELAVADIKAEYPDFEPGFAFYVVDRFANEIIDEN